VQTQLLSSADVIIGAIADPRDSAKSIKAQSSKLKAQRSRLKGLFSEVAQNYSKI
jgi:hypothetical protein